MAQNPEPFCTAGPVGDDLFVWQAVLTGPPDSPYDGGRFLLELGFPPNYPHSPPKARFATRQAYSLRLRLRLPLRLPLSLPLGLTRTLGALCDADLPPERAVGQWQGRGQRVHRRAALGTLAPGVHGAP